MENNNENAENIVIVNPAKETVALVKWLVANTCQEKVRGVYQRPKLASFEVAAAGRVYLATSGYTLAAAILEKEIREVDQLPDGHYLPVKITKDVIILEQYSLHSYEESLYAMIIPFLDTEGKYLSSKPIERLAFSPKLLANLAGGFDEVRFEFNGDELPVLVSLQINESLPEGTYRGVLMPRRTDNRQVTCRGIADKIRSLAEPKPTQEEESAEVVEEAELVSADIPL